MRLMIKRATLPADETAQTPVMRHEAGTVFAGRGMEQHGVPMTGTPDLVDDADAGEDVLTVEIPEDPDPIPVRLVRSGGREFTRLRIQRSSARDVESTQVVGRDETRNITRVRNLSSTAGDRLWVGEAQHIAQPAFGYPLDPGAELLLNTENEVYVSRDPAAPTNPLPFAVLVEYVVAVD